MNYPTSPRKETSSVSKLTVEYLKKFGQNRDLQQYFVLSAPLTISEENLNSQYKETKIPASILIESKKGPLWSDLNLPSTSRAYEDQKIFENDNTDTGRLSSASSVVSDKRLEWDSGADVGYVNYYNSKYKERSISLPALSTIESSGENSLSSTGRNTKKQTTFAVSTPTNNTQKFFQQDEVEITCIPKENAEVEENSQKTFNNLQKDKSISLEDTRLKPESSPKKSLSQIDLPNIEKSSVIENMYIFSPMFIKSLMDKKEGNLEKTDKIIQTTLERAQGQSTPENKKSSPNTSNGIDLFETAQNNNSSFPNTSDKFLTFAKADSRNQIPTSSSFEYIPGNEYKTVNLVNKDTSISSPNNGNDYELTNRNLNEVNTSTSDQLLPEKGDNSLYNITTSRSSNSDVSNQDSSGHSIGSILMGSQYSMNLTKDLEHTVSAMKNIIETKKYSEIDKKRLIRKIVKKIVNTHYDDDPESQFDESLNRNTFETPPLSDNLKSTPTSANHSDNNVSSEVMSSPTILTSFEVPKTIGNCTSISPEIKNSPTLLTTLDISKDANHCNNISSEVRSSHEISSSDHGNVINEEIPKTSTTDATVSWKKDITFSEQLFAERIKNLQNQRRQRDNQKKKRNIFTNVEQLQQKIGKDVVETGGDAILNNSNNKKLLKITEKERENQLNWVKSEIYYLNQLRLLLEDNISLPPAQITQVYSLFSNSLKKTSSTSPSDSDSYKRPSRPTTTSSINISQSNNNETDTSYYENEIDKIIQKNYILTESSLSNKKAAKTSHKTTDRDLQNKIIANIQDAQVKEIWKLDAYKNSSVLKKRYNKGNYRSNEQSNSFRSQISKKSESSSVSSSTSNIKLNCNLINKHNQKSSETSSDSGKHQTLNRQLSLTIAVQTDGYYEKSHNNQNLYYSKQMDNKNISTSEENSNLNSPLIATVGIQTDNDRKKEKREISNGSLKTDSCYEKTRKKKEEVVEKQKQRPEIFQHCRNSTTQTSDQKINSSSSGEEYVCRKCRKNAKVDKVTQTYINSEKNHKNRIKNECKDDKSRKTSKCFEIDNKMSKPTKNEYTSPLINFNTSSTDSSKNQQNSVEYTCSKCISSTNTLNLPKIKNQAVLPLCLDLKTYTDMSGSEQNSPSTFSQNSTQASPEIIQDSSTNSIEFVKNTDQSQKLTKTFQRFDKNNSSPKKTFKQIPNVNSYNYKTWPINAESFQTVDKLLPNSDRVQQESKSNLNKNDLVSSEFTKKISTKTLKDPEYIQHDARQDYFPPPNNNDCCHNKQVGDNKLHRTQVSKKCLHKKSYPEENASPSLDVRNVSSYSRNNYNNQLPDSVSRRSPNTRTYHSRELSEDGIQTTSKESIILQNFGDSSSVSHHSFIQENTNRSSHYSRTSSEIVIHENSSPLDNKHSRNSVQCMYHNPNFVSKSEHNLHKRIQEMLNRCEICSKQRIQKETQPQIEHCSECYCQCLDSNRQMDNCSCKPNMPLCNTCKLNQESYRYNSIAYFLKVESRDDLMVEESQSSSLQRRTAIEEVKIYVPKFVKRGSKVIPNNNVKYVEEIGLDHQNSVQSLKEYLSKNKPEFVHAANSRQEYLKEISKKRDKNVTKRIDCKIVETKQKISPKTSKLFSSRKMKEITYRKYRTLPEVEQKKYNLKLFRQRRANRLMVELFNKKLQQKVHKGELDLSLTKTLL